MFRRSGDAIRLATFAALLALGVGCACKPGMKAFDVRVQPRLAGADQPTPSSVEVNLVGVSQRDYARWASYPTGQYWRPNDPLRRDAQSTGRVHVMVLSADDPKAKVLSRSDPIWSKWREQGVMQLLVLAFLPGAQPGAGRQDPQRLILPLDNCQWKNVDTLDVTVEPTGITTRATPQPSE